MQLYSYCNIVGKTDVGCKRKANEDWLDNFECRNGLVAVVCDGMGGHVGGEVASHLAVETIRNFLENNYFDNPRQAIIEACNEANEAILRRTHENPELTGMGATCVMLLIRDGKVYYGSVGDSRIYLVRSKRITQLTVDQSYVQMLVDMGEITKEQAEHHPRKNEITNALGLESMKPATVAESPIVPEAGDCFILCSDGLSGMVSDEAILKIAGNQQNLSQKDRMDRLIELAKKNGGLDNITCQLVEFAVTPGEVVSKGGSSGRNIGKYIIAAALIIVLAAGAALLLSKKSAPESNTPVVLSDKTHVETYPDTIGYVPNETLLVLTENHDYKSVEVNLYNDGADYGKFIIKHDVRLDNIKISPERDVITTINGGIVTLSMNSVSDSRNLSLSFTDADSTYVYLFPIKYVERKTPVPAVPDNKVVKESPVDIVNRMLALPKVASAPEEPAPHEPAPQEPIKNDVVVNVGKEGVSTIKLKSEKGQNSDTELFTDYAIAIVDENGEWYRVHCSDRSEAVITVNNEAVPAESPLIVVPLHNTEDVYRIFVKRER